MRPEEIMIDKCVKAYLKNDAVFRQLNAKGIRAVCLMGYNMDVFKGKLLPIEQFEGKKEYWEFALTYEESNEVRIEIAKAAYYLASKI